ncbi:MAG TPA: UbiA-like polyprenyltransferase [Bryobacterales bacterium]|jgi:4-hydroxybenzoate polyprenyltransferase|nr:UbiA-like polyprenyltransferase [Bryobacterales bacterium]
MRALRKLRITLEMIKFEHSVFALPFALTGALLAAREEKLSLAAVGGKLGWVVLAMVSARSAAMAFNRLADAQIDARNPRTRMRAIPSGVLSRSFTAGFVAVASATFLLAAGKLNALCLKLAPLALGIVFFYSYTKRFTAFSHLILGFCLGIAPAAAWIAVRGRLDAPILLLTAAVMLWTAGFDIIYSCQDYDFDRRERLHSMPARLGIAPALWVARLLHAAMVVLLVWLAEALSLGPLSLAGVGLVTALLIYEHSLVRPGDLSRVNAAFFTVNGVVSVLFFLFWAADILYAAA